MARRCRICGDESCFDHCFDCGAAGCEDGMAEHAEGCSTNTGVHTVTEQDYGPECPHCGERIHGPMCCCDCKAELKLGDPYTHRWIEDDVAEIICLGCAAQEAVS